MDRLSGDPGVLVDRRTTLASGTAPVLSQGMGSQDKPPSPDPSDLFPVPGLTLARPTPARSGTAPITPVITPRPPGEATPMDADQPGYDQTGPWVVTGLREYDGVMEWELSRHIVRFHGGGSRKCEISLPERDLSATHFMLERRDRSLRLYDLHSARGTWVMDSRITTADLRAGSTFTAKPVTFVAMNDAMRKHRPDLVEIVGAYWGHSPDRIMVEAAGSGHLVITGEPGCEHERLAVAIHEMSPRQARELITIEPPGSDRAKLVEQVKRASQDAASIGTTVVLKLAAGATRLDETFLSMLFSPTYGIRVIVVGHHIDDARHALGESIVALFQHVLLRPLVYRKEEVDQLLDRRFRVRGAPQLRAAELFDHNRMALQRYSWPENLAELRLVADILVAYETQGGWRGAESDLGKPRSTMLDHTERVGLQTRRIEGARRGSTRHSFFQPSARTAPDGDA